MACFGTQTLGKTGGGIAVVLGVLNPSASASPSLIRSRTQGRIGTPCAPASELPQSKRRNNQNPSPDTPSTNHPRHLRPPRGPPVQPRIIPHQRTPKPRPRFRPPYGRCRLDSPKPSVPPTPRHPVQTANPATASTQPGRTSCITAVSPDGRPTPPTARAVVPPAPHSAAPDLPPLLEPPAAANTAPTAPRPCRHPKFQQRTQLQRRPRQYSEIAVNQPWNRHKQTYFNGLVRIPGCGLDTGPESLFPSNSMSTGTVARVPRPWLPNLPALAWLPASAPSVQSLPAPPTGRRTRPVRALPGPARSDVESHSATSPPLPNHSFPTAPRDSCRKPSSCGSAAHPRPPVGRAPSGTPNPARDNARHRVPHGPSGTGIPAATDPTHRTGRDLVAEGVPCVGRGRASLPADPLQRQPGNPARARPDSPPRTG